MSHRNGRYFNHLINFFAVICLIHFNVSCGSKMNSKKTNADQAMKTSTNKKKFGEDAAFILKYTDGFVLSIGKQKIIVVPKYQGRIMTSTANGDDGFSFGWMNNSLIESGKFGENFSAFGGEDRFWIGPEAGKYGIFYDKGKAFKWENWRTPAYIDKETFELVNKSSASASFRHQFEVVNYSGNHFQVKVNRTIQLLTRTEAEKILNYPIDEKISVVAFQSNNEMINIGESSWNRETGLLNIWIVGIFSPSENTNVVIPIMPGNDSALGYRVTDDYFKPVPEQRLKSENNAVYFKGDGQFQCKIGVNHKRSKGILGSYDPVNKVLTIIKFNQPDSYFGYANHLSNEKNGAYDGDAIMSYNDGPVNAGEKPFGPYYELETNSPVKELAPGNSLKHIHTTIHFQGDTASLNKLSLALLGVSLEKIQSALK
jgi:hypothetical protein